MLKSILKELRDLKKHGMTEEELRRSKDHLKGSLMLSLESTSSRMNRLAKHEMHLGSFLTMDEMLAAIDGVRHDEVQALVSQVLDEERLALTTLGPLDRRNLPANSADPEGDFVPLPAVVARLDGAPPMPPPRPATKAGLRGRSPRSKPPTCSG